MQQQTIDIVFDFPQAPAKIFNWLGDHNNLGLVFAPFKVKRIRDGQGYLNGVGSVRRLTAFPMPPVEETVTVYEPEQRIEYTITSPGGPIRDHLGVMRFEPNGEGTRLHYTITFTGRLPLAGPVLKVGLEQGILRGFRKLARMSIG